MNTHNRDLSVQSTRGVNMSTTRQHDLRDQKALVTGATSGLGRAIAFQLVRDGAEVIVHGRDAARGIETIEAIAAAGGQARFSDFSHRHVQATSPVRSSPPMAVARRSSANHPGCCSSSGHVKMCLKALVGRLLDQCRWCACRVAPSCPWESCNGYLEYPFEKMTISSFHPSLSLPNG
jgi:shikimate 5-dehydrogenase